MANHLNESEIQARREKGIEITLAGMLSHLRSIKQMEMSWLALYSTIMIATTGYMFARDSDMFPSESAPLWISIVVTAFLTVLYLTFTYWAYQVLFTERQSYYTVLRVVHRSQNYFMITDQNNSLFTVGMYNSIFPKGFGRGTGRCGDGTQRKATYLYRNIYVGMVSAVLMSAIYHQYGLLATVIAFTAGAALNGLAIWRFHCRDKMVMTEKVGSERHLLGADVNDYPELEVKTPQ